MRFSPVFVLLVALFVTVLITANITAVKLFQPASLTLPWSDSAHLVILPAGVLVFPLSYIIGDVLTEVYGYRVARGVIWLGFTSNAVVVLFIWLAGLVPAAPGWDAQGAYDRILGFTPRLLLASFAGYLLGEFSNSIVLSRLKLATKGRWLWVRTVVSTIVGQGLDSLVFITIAFSGIVPGVVLAQIVVTQWLAKVIYEAAATPLTYAVVGFVKRKEGVDTYDRGVSFNPLAIFG